MCSDIYTTQTKTTRHNTVRESYWNHIIQRKNRGDYPTCKIKALMIQWRHKSLVVCLNHRQIDCFRIFTLDEIASKLFFTGPLWGKHTFYHSTHVEFSAATMHIYERCRPPVWLSFHPSVTPFSQCSLFCTIMAFQRVITIAPLRKANDSAWLTFHVLTNDVDKSAVLYVWYV